MSFVVIAFLPDQKCYPGLVPKPDTRQEFGILTSSRNSGILRK